MLQALAADQRFRVILGLIVLDIMMGVAKALRTGTFKWEEVARFYRTTVLPIFIGWAALYFVLPYMSTELLGPGGSWLGEGLLTAFWLAGIAALLSSIWQSVKCLGVATDSAPKY